MEIEEIELDKLRYPIGRFKKPAGLSAAERESLINDMELLPSRLELLMEQFDEKTLAQTYRPESWTARQIFHHLADSHINSFTRLKLALTEEKPVIRPYDENEWAKLPDYLDPIEESVEIVKCIHSIMVKLYKGLSEEQWQRTYFHPESQQFSTVQQLLALYAWHGNHHLEHLKICLRNG